MTSPTDLITVTVLGETFRCTRRTHAHLLWTVQRLARLHPTARLRIIQTCYNSGVDASAGTHDFDAVFDVEIVGLDWWAAQRFLRDAGWFAWFRYPPSFTNHIHMGSIPSGGRSFSQKVGIYVPGQLVDYYNHTYGLKGQHNVDLDKSWFPGDVGSPPPVGTPTQWRQAIDKTIFDYPAYLAEEIAAMPLNADDKKWITDQFNTSLANALAKAGETIKIDNPAEGGAKRSLSAMLVSIYGRINP